MYRDAGEALAAAYKLLVLDVREWKHSPTWMSSTSSRPDRCVFDGGSPACCDNGRACPAPASTCSSQEGDGAMVFGSWSLPPSLALRLKGLDTEGPVRVNRALVAGDRSPVDAPSSCRFQGCAGDASCARSPLGGDRALWFGRSPVHDELASLRAPSVDGMARPTRLPAPLLATASRCVPSECWDGFGGERRARGLEILPLMTRIVLGWEEGWIL